MGISLEDSARHLWRAAPWWRASVLAAALFAVAWAVRLGYLAVGVPQSDARFAAYVSACAGARRLAEGERCEQCAAALTDLTTGDLARRGERQRWDEAVTEGESCRDKLADSDTRFAVLEQAATAAGTNPASVEAAADAFAALNEFDRSRKRFAEEQEFVGKAKGYVAAVAASDRRLAWLARQTAAFERSRSPADALGAVDALKGTTGLDRVRSSSGSRERTLAAAEAADRAVARSRAKLSRLPDLVAAAENARTPESEKELVASVAAVTPFDEGVATAQQRQALSRARAAAAGLAWTMLRQSVTAVDRGGSASEYEAVVMPYEFLKDTPPGSLGGDRRVLLSKARADAEAVAASDARLAGLLKAEGVWRQRGVAGGDVVSSAFTAVTPFDRSRFDGADNQAWEAVSRAELVLDGPKLGLTAATKDRIWIFVAAADKSADTSEVVDALSGALRRAGFQVAGDRRDAALVAEITVEGVDEPQQDLSGGFLQWVSTARVGVRALWAAGGSALFSGEVAETAKTRDEGAVQAQALLACVDAILDRFTKAAGP
ncbi:MAG: hypothetical protein ACREQ4_14145 [Candidatus Binataceae bacterium]